MERIKVADFPIGEVTPHHQTLTTDEFEGLPYEALPDCPKCAGAGFVHPLGPDEKVDYSQTIPCDYLGCLADQSKSHKLGVMIENSGVTERKQSFENFNTSIKGVSKAYQAAERIAEGSKGFKWLIIYGGVGNGKTHLLNAIANRVMDRGIPVRLVMMAELLGELRSAIETHQVDFKIRELKEIPCLLIDEYGLELGSDWEKEKIEELLAARWNRGLFTVVVTNKDIEQLPPRLKSRFLDRQFSRAVLNEAGDYRAKRGR